MSTTDKRLYSEGFRVGLGGFDVYVKSAADARALAAAFAEAARLLDDAGSEPGPADGSYCDASDNGRFTCTLAAGHDWPEHIAHGSRYGDDVCHRWPATCPECQAQPPGRQLTRSRIPAGPEHAAGSDA